MPSPTPTRRRHAHTPQAQPDAPPTSAARAASAPSSTEATGRLLQEVLDQLRHLPQLERLAERLDRAARGLEDAWAERASPLDLLLAGHDATDREAGASLRKSGWLDGRQTYCVVLARSVDAAHMRDAARARRLADALDALVPTALARRLIDVRDGQVVAVLAGQRRVSGWTAPLPPLSVRVADHLARAGNDVLIGLSPDVAATSGIPSARRQAALALQLAHPGRRVCAFEALTPRAVMLHQAAPVLRDLLPAWHTPLLAADRRIGGALLQSLRAHARTSLNVLKTAAHLEAHPNTIYARFERIRALTGLDPRQFEGLEALLLVLDAADMQQPAAPAPPAPGGRPPCAPARSGRLSAPRIGAAPRGRA